MNSNMAFTYTTFDTLKFKTLLANIQTTDYFKEWWPSRSEPWPPAGPATPPVVSSARRSPAQLPAASASKPRPLPHSEASDLRQKGEENRRKKERSSFSQFLLNKKQQRGESSDRAVRQAPRQNPAPTGGSAHELKWSKQERCPWKFSGASGQPPGSGSSPAARRPVASRCPAPADVNRLKSPSDWEKCVSCKNLKENALKTKSFTNICSRALETKSNIFIKHSLWTLRAGWLLRFVK